MIEASKSDGGTTEKRRMVILLGAVEVAVTSLDTVGHQRVPRTALVVCRSAPWSHCLQEAEVVIVQPQRRKADQDEVAPLLAIAPVARSAAGMI